MGLNIEVKGDPASLNATVRQLRALVDAVDDGAMAVRRAGADSEDDWRGHSGDEFRGLVRRADGKIGEFGERIGLLAGKVSAYADDLAEVKALMRQAAEAALRGGLTVSETEIGDPGPAPIEATDASPTGLYTLKVRAFQAAAQLVRRARALYAAAKARFLAFWGEVRQKLVFNLADLGSGIAAALTAVGSTYLGKTMRMVNGYASLDGFQKRTGKTVPWMPKLGKQITTRLSWASWFNAGLMTKGPLKYLPQTGLVITTLGVQYDIAVLKKDPLSSIVSGYGGYVAGAAAGALLVSFGVGLVPAAVIGFGVSLGIGGEIEDLMK